MANLNGNELVLYSYKDLEPIGCEESFTLNLTSTEIITTTKGSGRSTNREYGAYDWNIQAAGVITVGEEGKTNPLHFNDNLIKGKKVAVKAVYGGDFYFGIGIVTSATNTGTSGDLAKYDVTITADGPLYSTNNLKNTENEPYIFEYSSTTYPTSFSSISLLGATLLIVFVGDVYYAPDTYEFIADNGYGSGVITFDTTLPIGKTVRLFVVPLVDI
jgi:hypothetical protein